MLMLELRPEKSGVHNARETGLFLYAILEANIMMRDKDYGLVSSKQELEMLRRLNKEVSAMRVRRCRYHDCHAYAEFPNHYCNKHIAHEAEYLASRAKWAHKQNKTQVRRYNTITRNRNETKREQYNFYRSRQWSHLRQQALERDHYLCQYCKAIGKITPNCKTADHVRPVEAFPDDKDNINNLATTCRKCHYKKTEFEQKYYGCGQGNTLTGAKPIDNINELALIMRRN